MKIKNLEIKIIFLSIFLISLSQVNIFAQDFTQEGAPDGMEMRVVGQTKIIVPQGAKVEQKGGFYTVEPVDKYVARILWQIKQETKDKIQEQKIQNEKLAEQIKSLKEEINTANVKIEELEAKVQAQEKISKANQIQPVLKTEK